MVVDLDNVADSFSVSPGGQSGSPLRKHYDDMGGLGGVTGAMIAGARR